MLVKKNQGGSILSAEMLVKNNLTRKNSNCSKAGKKQFQGGSILTDEILV